MLADWQQQQADAAAAVAPEDLHHLQHEEVVAELGLSPAELGDRCDCCLNPQLTVCLQLLKE